MSQSFMPEVAPLVVLAFLGTAALLAALLLAAAASAVLGKRSLAGWLAVGGTLVAAGYGATLIAFSLASRETVLKPGDRKYFCEIDCHLAYSVEGVEATVVPAGTIYAVSLKTWFDPNTVASFRGNAPLTPNPRVAFLVDEAGKRYPAPKAALESLARVLRPGESFLTTLSFETPAAIGRPRLLLVDPPGLEAFLIGHENSPFHGKIYFALEPAGKG